jgi:hypothetical protein
MVEASCPSGGSSVAAKMIDGFIFYEPVQEKRDTRNNTKDLDIGPKLNQNYSQIKFYIE